jgi:hypothetical protein
MATAGLFPDSLTPTSGSRRVLVAPMIIAATSLGFAIQLHDGEFSPDATGQAAIALLTLSLVACAVSVIGPALRRVELRRFEHFVLPLFKMALFLQFLTLFIAWPGRDVIDTIKMSRLPFWAGLMIASGLLIFGPHNGLRSWFPLLLAVFAALGIWTVHYSPQPAIDVWMFQQNAAAELLHGHNPYAMTFPDIYHSTLLGHQQVYGTGLVVEDRLQFGFPYPPVSLLLATVGYLAVGDHRYAQVAALVLAGLFMGYSGRGRIAMPGAALFLFMPRVFFVLGRGWTEPFVVMLLAATIFCACRRSRWLPVALGLFLATKQYLIFAVPLTYFLLPSSEDAPGGIRWRAWFDLLWKTILTAAIVTLPFVLWDPHAFWKSTMSVQELAPFRWDALSYLVWYGFRGHLVTQPSTALIWSTLAALVTLALSLWRSPRTPAGFAASLSLLSIAFFAFNKQAFCNYYFFVIGAMCCAIAASSFEASVGLLRSK